MFDPVRELKYTHYESREAHAVFDQVLEFRIQVTCRSGFFVFLLTKDI